MDELWNEFDKAQDPDTKNDPETCKNKNKFLLLNWILAVLLIINILSCLQVKNVQPILGISISSILT